MTTKLFQNLVQRDINGLVWHPDLDQFTRGHDGGDPRQEESDDLDLLAIRAAGYEVRNVWLDENPDEVDYAAESPEGEGWMLVAAVDGLDGGTSALWVRPLVVNAGAAP